MAERKGLGIFLIIFGLILVIIGALALTTFFGYILFIIGLIVAAYGRDIRVGIEDNFFGHLSGKKYREFKKQNKTKWIDYIHKSNKFVNY